MSLRRPTVACLLFTFNISPFYDVAQTSDCGISVIYFHYKPFPRCRIDVRLWPGLSFTFNISPLCGVAQTPDCGIVNLFAPLFEESFIPSFGTQYLFFGISGGLPPDFPFISHALLSHCLSALY